MKTSNIKNICVFCGASAGNKPIYSQAAEQFAKALLEAQLTLIYGGAKIGIMGIIADYMLKNGGKVIGVMPQSLVDVEIAHKNLTELHIVQSMSERKILLAELSDAFVMLPGGAGSLDEFFEMYTQAYLGYHSKPCGILNTNNYYQDLIKFLDRAVDDGFLNLAYRNMIIIENNPQILLQKFSIYRPPVKKFANVKTLEKTNAKN